MVGVVPYLGKNCLATAKMVILVQLMFLVAGTFLTDLTMIDSAYQDQTPVSIITKLLIPVSIIDISEHK